MAMTDNEIENLAQEMVDHSVAQQIAAELTKQAIRARGRSKCVCCGSFNTKKDKTVKGVHECKDCSTVFGEGFQHKYPKWAQGKKSHFRKFFSLAFNIQG